MVSRHSLHAIVAAGLLIPLAGPGAIRLVNRAPVPLTVEIRAALGTDCAKGSSVASQQLRPGAAWTVQSSQPLCVRWEKLDTAGQRRMQAWERRDLATGKVEEVDL